MPGRRPGFESCLGHSPAWCPRGKLLRALGLRGLSCKPHDLNRASYTTTHGCGRSLEPFHQELSPCLVQSRAQQLEGPVKEVLLSSVSSLGGSPNFSKESKILKSPLPHLLRALNWILGF